MPYFFDYSKDMAVLTMTSKRQITLTREVCRTLGLDKGTRLDVRLSENRELILRKAAPFVDTHGMLSHYAKSKPVSLQEMREAVRRGAAESYRKSIK